MMIQNFKTQRGLLALAYPNHQRQLNPGFASAVSPGIVHHELPQRRLHGPYRPPSRWKRIQSATCGRQDRHVRRDF